MHIRVHELAQELGISSGRLLEKCSARGEFVKSASSTLPPSLVQALREECAPKKPENDCSDYGLGRSRNSLSNNDDGGFAEAFARAQRASRRPGHHSKRTEPSAIETALYRYMIDPTRTRPGRYTPEERDRVERKARRWAETWLEDQVEWIAVSGGEHIDTAIELSRAGLSAADAGLRLGFGRFDSSSPTIFDRVSRGTMGLKDAVLQVKDFRRSESA